MREQRWVRCLNCGHEYFLELPNSKQSRCPRCYSKEIDVDDDFSETRNRGATYESYNLYL